MKKDKREKLKTKIRRKESINILEVKKIKMVIK
jgi:hypothetical protein